jgi:hypothetical protein
VRAFAAAGPIGGRSTFHFHRADRHRRTSTPRSSHLVPLMWGQQQFGGGFGPAGGGVAQVGANVCGGLCCGLLMFFFNVWLIFWNEGALP